VDRPFGLVNGFLDIVNADGGFELLVDLPLNPYRVEALLRLLRLLHDQVVVVADVSLGYQLLPLRLLKEVVALNGDGDAMCSVVSQVSVTLFFQKIL